VRRLWLLLFILPGCFESPVTSFEDDEAGEADATMSPTSGGSSSAAGTGSSAGITTIDPTLVSSSSSSGAMSFSTSDGSASSGGGASGERSTSSTSVEPEESSTSDEPETTGTIPDSCGDGVLDDDEVCDAGDDNGVEAGDCAPDCSAQVQERTIVVATTNLAASFASGSDTVVGVLDDACVAEFGAGALSMFVHGDERRATLGAYAGDGAIDWVLDPWTRYVNDADELVWVTESIALLGVDGSGDNHDLLHPLWVYVDNNPAFTGMNIDWTTQVDADCNGWTLPAGGTLGAGNPWFVGDGDFLRLPGTSTCGNSRGFYCVLP